MQDVIDANRKIAVEKETAEKTLFMMEAYHALKLITTMTTEDTEYTET